MYVYTYDMYIYSTVYIYNPFITSFTYSLETGSLLKKTSQLLSTLLSSWHAASFSTDSAWRCETRNWCQYIVPGCAKDKTPARQHWKVDGAKLPWMSWFIMAPKTNPPFGSGWPSTFTTVFLAWVPKKYEYRFLPAVLSPACSHRMMRPVAPCFFACAAAWQTKENSRLKTQILNNFDAFGFVKSSRHYAFMYTLPETNSKSNWRLMIGRLSPFLLGPSAYFQGQTCC